MPYQLTATHSILRLLDGAHIPIDPANLDYAEYLAWLSRGNQPLPAATPSAEQLASEARTWRDAELQRADVSLNKVLDGVGTGTEAGWRSYRVELRDWPRTPRWPACARPTYGDL